MRKKLLFPLLIPALTFAFSSCANSQSFNGKIYIEFGRIYTGEEESVPSMNYETLKSRIENSETFAMVISRNPGSCGCWTVFEPILLRFNKKYNLDIRHITAEDLNIESDKFGLHTVLGDNPSIAFFNKGKLVRQITYAKSRDPFTVEDGSALEKVFFANAVLPKMFYVTESVLDSYIASEDTFSIYYARRDCGDCKALNKTVLNKWNTTVKSVENPLYVFDMQDYWVNVYDEKVPQEKKDAYNRIKAKYGIAVYNAEFDLGNDDYGYRTGAFPTLQHRTSGNIDDACVVYNDSVNKENLTISSYFSQERLPKLKFLDGTEDKYILDGKQITSEQANKWRSSYQASLHDPIAKLFLEKYIK